MHNHAVNSVTQFVAFVLLAVVSASPAFAGGLDAATGALTTFKVWLYSILGLIALIYLGWNVAMAFAERKTWGDVGMALVYCAIAGGASVAGTWAIETFQ